MTLDDDIAAKLREVAKKAGRPFKQVVNETLRLGLNAKRTIKPRKPFTVRTRDTGLRPGFELDCVSSLLEWLAVPSVTVLGPGERHWEIFAELLQDFQCRGQLVMDVHLAALAIEHGASLYTTDKDFGRFDQVQVVNPLG